MEDVLLYFALIYNGDFAKIYKAIEQKKKIDFEELKKLKKLIKCKYTTIISDDYPSSLKEISSPPFVLFYYGNLKLCENRAISVVGMRKCSNYGKEMATYICQKLSNEFTIVSGMALGIDSYAHLGAIEIGSTIAVLGCGIDYCYPSSNIELYERLKKEHLVISEYPGNLKPQKNFFRNRNRIVSGLGEKLIVIEALRKSGTMISVGYALEQGKDVYCVPGRFFDHDGCNYLINQGANILMSIDDLY